MGYQLCLAVETLLVAGTRGIWKFLVETVAVLSPDLAFVPFHKVCWEIQLVVDIVEHLKSKKRIIASNVLKSPLGKSVVALLQSFGEGLDVIFVDNLVCGVSADSNRERLRDDR